MKITSLHVYPIKSLRGISLPSTLLTPLGIPHDRTFMLFEVKPDRTLTKIQIDSHPRCARFWQEFRPFPSDINTAAQLAITFIPPSPSSSPPETLTIPLVPALDELTPITVDLHGSPAEAYRMPDEHAQWFGERLGVEVVFVYLGDGRREVLGETLRPPAAPKGWLESVAGYLGGGTAEGKPPAYLTFTDAGALLVTSQKSLREINETRLPEGSPTSMFKFRPNVVVDGEGEEAWDEDFWGELEIGTGDGDGEKKKVVLTGNCVRCMSLNVDYETGRMAEGELGTVLKKLARDRRVDPGHRWSPVFGRYGFPVVGEGEEGFVVRVGEEVRVSKRNEERTRWDWPGM